MFDVLSLSPVLLLTCFFPHNLNFPRIPLTLSAVPPPPWLPPVLSEPILRLSSANLFPTTGDYEGQKLTWSSVRRRSFLKTILNINPPLNLEGGSWALHSEESFCTDLKKKKSPTHDSVWEFHRDDSAASEEEKETTEGPHWKKGSRSDSRLGSGQSSWSSWIRTITDRWESSRRKEHLDEPQNRTGTFWKESVHTHLESNW